MKVLRNWFATGPTWSQLSGLGKSGALRTSYFWFIAVPLAARSINALNVIIERTLARLLPGVTRWHIELPFSWRLFFVASVAFATASLVYSMRCPRLVREHASAASFEGSGGNALHLAHAFLAAVFGTPRLRRSPQQMKQEIWSLVRMATDAKFSDVQDAPESRESLQILLAQLSWDQSKVPQLFWLTRRLADRSYPVARYFCAACYCVGLVFLAWVFYQNIWSVVGIWF